MTKITAEDRTLIKNLRIEKQWSTKRMMKEFPNKAWSIASVNRLIKKLLIRLYYIVREVSLFLAHPVVRELLRIKFYIAGIGIFYLFGSCNRQTDRTKIIYHASSRVVKNSNSSY